jgi:hypothetical protein
MATAFERRMVRAVATTTEIVARSQWVIWCFEPEKMPAMIDLLIAQGRLSESDRPCCVHWRAVKGPDPLSGEEIWKIVDADEMLQDAGIRTLMAQGWEACMQGTDALEAFMRDRYGELGSADSDEIRKLDAMVQPLRAARACVAQVGIYTQTCISLVNNKRPTPPIRPANAGLHGPRSRAAVPTEETHDDIPERRKRQSGRTPARRAQQAHARRRKHVRSRWRRDHSAADHAREER